MKAGYLMKDSVERFNLKRGCRVNAWRIVDEAGKDLVQPWSATKADARTVAKTLGIVILGDWPPAIQRVTP